MAGGEQSGPIEISEIVDVQREGLEEGGKMAQPLEATAQALYVQLEVHEASKCLNRWLNR